MGNTKITPEVQNKLNLDESLDIISKAVADGVDVAEIIDNVLGEQEPRTASAKANMNQIEHAVRVALAAAGRGEISAMEIAGLLPEGTDKNLIVSAIAKFKVTDSDVSAELLAKATQVAGPKVDAGVVKANATAKQVEEEVFALMGTGKGTANNKGTPEKGGQNLA